MENIRLYLNKIVNIIQHNFGYIPDQRRGMTDLQAKMLTYCYCMLKKGIPRDEVFRACCEKFNDEWEEEQHVAS